MMVCFGVHSKTIQSVRQSTLKNFFRYVSEEFCTFGVHVYAIYTPLVAPWPYDRDQKKAI